MNAVVRRWKIWFLKRYGKKTNWLCEKPEGSGVICEVLQWEFGRQKLRHYRYITTLDAETRECCYRAGWVNLMCMTMGVYFPTDAEYRFPSPSGCHSSLRQRRSHNELVRRLDNSDLREILGLPPWEDA